MRSAWQAAHLYHLSSQLGVALSAWHGSHHGPPRFLQGGATQHKCCQAGRCGGGPARSLEAAPGAAQCVAGRVRLHGCCSVAGMAARRSGGAGTAPGGLCRAARIQLAGLAAAAWRRALPAARLH